MLQVNGTNGTHEKLHHEVTALKQQVKDYEIHIKQLQTQLETAAAAAAAAKAASVAMNPGSGTSAEVRCKQLEVGQGGVLFPHFLS